MTAWLRLGLRMSLGSGRTGAGRVALMASGAAIGMTLLLATLAVPAVIDVQHARVVARTPVAADGAGGQLRLAEIDDAIGARRLTRVAVTGVGDAGPLPPGVARLPRPGEAVVSPALAELIVSDARARNRFPQRMVGAIGPTGLVAPDELRAYVGVPEATLADDRYLVTGFGTPRDDGGPERTAPERPATWETLLTTERVMAFVFALFVLVPLGVFLATCARLSAAARDRRLAALRLLGASSRQAQLVNAVENAAVTLVGAAVGYLAFAALRPASQSWRLGRFHWYADTVTAPGWRVGALTAVLVAYAVAIGALASAPAIRQPLATRRDAPLRRPSALWSVPFAAGSALIVAAGLLPLPLVVRTALFGVGVLLAAAGLPLLLTVLGSGVGRAMAGGRRAPVWLALAGRRLDHTPSVAPRLTGAIAVCVLSSGIGLFAAAGYASLERPTAANGVAYLTHDVFNVDAGLVDTLRAAPSFVGVSAAEVTTATVPGVPGEVAVRVGECRDLQALYAGAEGCVDGRSYRLDLPYQREDALPTGGTATVRVGGTTAPVPVPTQTLRLTPRTGSGWTTSLYVTRKAIGGAEPPPRDPASPW